MTLAEFKASLSSATPPAGLSPALVALWHDGQGDWNTAHSVAQDIDGKVGAWVHAYLHRKEGDLSNASYWYRMAGKVDGKGPELDEWATIAEELLESLPGA